VHDLIHCCLACVLAHEADRFPQASVGMHVLIIEFDFSFCRKFDVSGNKGLFVPFVSWKPADMHAHVIDDAGKLVGVAFVECWPIPNTREKSSNCRTQKRRGLRV
jgi:hypothetical protein